MESALPAPRLTPRAALDLAILGVVWGGSFLAVRVALDSTPVAWVVAHRVAWAALALWIAVVAMGLPLPRGAGLWVRLATMGLLNNVIPFALIAWGQQHIEVGLAAILNAITAVLTVLVAAALIPGERLTLRRGIGVTAGLAGVALAIGPAALTGFDLRSAGQLAVVAASFSYALAFAWARRALAGVHPAISAAGMLTASAAMAVPAAVLTGGPPVLPDLPSLAALAWLALPATALAYLLYFRIVAAAGAGNAGLVTLIVPPVAILLGAAVRGEALAPDALAGFAVMAAGLLILNPPRLRVRRAPGPPPHRPVH